jgi:hypothetical protein
MVLIDAYNDGCPEDSCVRAPDDGWHMMPSANSDTHNADWIVGRDMRTVLLAERLTPTDLDAVVRSLVLGPAAGTQTATRRVKGLSAAARHFWPHVSTASDDVTAGPGVTAWTAAVWTGRQARRPETSSTARGSHRRPPARPERTAQRACRDPPGRATRTHSAARARAR